MCGFSGGFPCRWCSTCLQLRACFPTPRSSLRKSPPQWLSLWSQLMATFCNAVAHKRPLIFSTTVGAQPFGFFSLFALAFLSVSPLPLLRCTRSREDQKIWHVTNNQPSTKARRAWLHFRHVPPDFLGDSLRAPLSHLRGRSDPTFPVWGGSGKTRPTPMRRILLVSQNSVSSSSHLLI